ncbi:MAG: alkaline phosphatase family protein [Anaerolineales bacterium]|jgi:predicted AlkP superfamily pyrophosphatase or phosphodiesterase|nr:alkaline phosphatase family protein [Anaerolineales bacterium]
MSRYNLVVILCLAALACQSQIMPIPTETPTLTPEPTLTPTATLTPKPTLTPTPAPLTRRVLILSIDGFRPDAMPLAPMPFLMTLLEKSAYSLTAQTVYPSVTLVAHTSMLSGQCPAKHKVDWNDYIPENGYAQVTDLFDIAHAAGMQTVMYVGKEKLRQVTEPPSTDIFKFINDRDLVITEDLLQNFPADFRLMFVHFPTPDFMGHEYGWLSPEQLSVLFRADQAIEKLVTELESRGLMEETLFIITADHGGHDTTHGYSLPEDMTIPWIAFGAGVQPAALNSSITTTDTAATAAFALNLPIPAEWDGVPIYEAFGLPVEKLSAGCAR